MQVIDRKTEQGHRQESYGPHRDASASQLTVNSYNNRLYVISHRSQTLYDPTSFTCKYSKNFHDRQSVCKGQWANIGKRSLTHIKNSFPIGRNCPELE